MSHEHLVDLFAHLTTLKQLKRTGWLDRGVPPEQVESVADHSLLTSVIAYVVACDDSSLDATKVLSLAALHDLAESIAGDPTPYDTADIPPASDPAAIRAFFSVRHPRSEENRKRKREREAAAVTELLALMPEGAARTFRALWDEYDAQATPEARFVKEVDLLEAFLQAQEYTERFPDLPFNGFRLQAMEEITHPVLAGVRDARLAG